MTKREAATLRAVHRLLRRSVRLHMRNEGNRDHWTPAMDALNDAGVRVAKLLKRHGKER